MNIIKIFMMCVLVFNAIIPFSYAAKGELSSSNDASEPNNSMIHNKCPDFTLEKIIDELFLGNAEINHDDLGFEKSSWALTREADHDLWREVLKKGAVVERITTYPYFAFDDLYIKKEKILNKTPEEDFIADIHLVPMVEKKLYIPDADKKMFCDYTVSYGQQELQFTVFQELEDADIDKLEAEELQRIIEATKFQQEEEDSVRVYELAKKMAAHQNASHMTQSFTKKTNTDVFRGMFLGGLIVGIGALFLVKSDTTS